MGRAVPWGAGRATSARPSHLREAGAASRDSPRARERVGPSLALSRPVRFARAPRPDDARGAQSRLYCCARGARRTPLRASAALRARGFDCARAPLRRGAAAFGADLYTCMPPIPRPRHPSVLTSEAAGGGLLGGGGASILRAVLRQFRRVCLPTAPAPASLARAFHVLAPLLRRWIFGAEGSPSGRRKVPGEEGARSCARRHCCVSRRYGVSQSARLTNPSSSMAIGAAA